MSEQLTIGEIIEFLRQRNIYVGIWVGEWDADGLAKPSDRLAIEAWWRCPNVDLDLDDWAQEPFWVWGCRASEFEEAMTSLYELAQQDISDPCTCLACERVRDQGGRSMSETHALEDVIRDTLWGLFGYADERAERQIVYVRVADHLYGYSKRAGAHPDTEAAYADCGARIVGDLTAAGYRIVRDGEQRNDHDN